jgi:hypothetical protein
MNRNERIAQQLGMSHGAAAGKLRKQVLFHLLERLKENVCFKCNELILTPDDLSIEHKKPWEGRDASLFWDLENIAFSHCDCNRPHIHGGGLHRPTFPPGMIWCSGHKQLLPESNFYKDSSTWHGFRFTCKECFDKDRIGTEGRRRKISAADGTCQT